MENYNLEGFKSFFKDISIYILLVISYNTKFVYHFVKDIFPNNLLSQIILHIIITSIIWSVLFYIFKKVHKILLITLLIHYVFTSSLNFTNLEYKNTINFVVSIITFIILIIEERIIKKQIKVI